MTKTTPDQKLVPLKPTQEMIDAANEVSWAGDVVVVEKMYEAMLAAAPVKP